MAFDVRIDTWEGEVARGVMMTNCLEASHISISQYEIAHS